MKQQHEYITLRWKLMTEEQRKEELLKIRFNTYKLLCREPVKHIINYDKAAADNFDGWELHHLLETHRYTDRSRTRWMKRDERIPKKVLEALGLYEHRSAKEFVFLRDGDHTRLHSIGNSHRKGKRGPYKTPEEKAASKKKRDTKRNEYYCQRCIYNGKEMSLGCLSAIFSKSGDPHPCQSAKRYIIDNHQYGDISKIC